MTHVLIENGWYDQDFVRRWTNAPLLVRGDDARLVRADEVFPDGDPAQYVAWGASGARPVVFDPAHGGYGTDEAQFDLRGTHELPTSNGPLTCRPVFDVLPEEFPRLVGHRGGRTRTAPVGGRRYMGVPSIVGAITSPIHPHGSRGVLALERAAVFAFAAGELRALGRRQAADLHDRRASTHDGSSLSSMTTEGLMRSRPRRSSGLRGSAVP